MVEINLETSNEINSPPKIIILAHGQTEEVFYEFLIREYFHHKLNEDNLSGSGEWLDEPRIILFNDKTKVQSHEIESRLKVKLDDESFINQNFNCDDIENSNIYFIVGMDFNEINTNNQRQLESNLLVNDARDEIKDSLRKMDISNLIECDCDLDFSKSFRNSKVIYFDDGIEKHFSNHENYKMIDPNEGKKHKHKKMRKFLKLLEIESTADLEKFVSEIKVENLSSNINELFQFLDIIYFEFKQYLSM